MPSSPRGLGTGGRGSASQTSMRTRALSPDTLRSSDRSVPGTARRSTSTFTTYSPAAAKQPRRITGVPAHRQPLRRRPGRCAGTGSSPASPGMTNGSAPGRRSRYRERRHRPVMRRWTSFGQPSMRRRAGLSARETGNPRCSGWTSLSCSTSLPQVDLAGTGVSDDRGRTGPVRASREATASTNSPV